MLNLVPVQASTLSQSSSVTVTGGHYYTYTYYQEVQTGTQQVQTGTTTQQVAVGGYSVCFSQNGVGGYQGNVSAWGTASSINGMTAVYNSATCISHTYYSNETVPVYTTEPVYTNEQFTGTAWSPATITYS